MLAVCSVVSRSCVAVRKRAVGLIGRAQGLDLTEKAVQLVVKKVELEGLRSALLLTGMALVNWTIGLLYLVVGWSMGEVEGRKLAKSGRHVWPVPV